MASRVAKTQLAGNPRLGRGGWQSGAPITRLWHRAGSGPLPAAITAGVALLVAAGIALLVLGLLRTSGESNVTGPPFRIVGPLDPQEALSGDYLAASGFVLNVASEQVYVIDKDPKNFEEGDSFLPTLWRDDDTLFIEATVGGAKRAYYASLNGRIQPAPLATPIGSRIVVFSADEKWLFALAGQNEIDVARAGENPTVRLTNALGAQWSPTGSTLAFIGNICAGFDAFTFNPATQELRNLTASLHPLVFGLAWRPDGAALAADIVPLGEKHRVLGLIDAATGDMQPLIDVPIEGGLSPETWSPGGTRLLFSYGSGHGVCEGEAPPADPFAPPPSQTTVEQIGG